MFFVSLILISTLPAALARSAEDFVALTKSALTEGIKRLLKTECDAFSWDSNDDAYSNFAHLAATCFHPKIDTTAYRILEAVVEVAHYSGAAAVETDSTVIEDVAATFRYQLAHMDARQDVIEFRRRLGFGLGAVQKMSELSNVNASLSESLYLGTMPSYELKEALVQNILDIHHFPDPQSAERESQMSTRNSHLSSALGLVNRPRPLFVLAIPCSKIRPNHDHLISFIEAVSTAYQVTDFVDILVVSTSPRENGIDTKSFTIRANIHSLLELKSDFANGCVGDGVDKEPFKTEFYKKILYVQSSTSDVFFLVDDPDHGDSQPLNLIFAQRSGKFWQKVFTWISRKRIRFNTILLGAYGLNMYARVEHGITRISMLTGGKLALIRDWQQLESVAELFKPDRHLVYSEHKEMQFPEPRSRPNERRTYFTADSSLTSNIALIRTTTMISQQVADLELKDETTCTKLALEFYICRDFARQVVPDGTIVQVYAKTNFYPVFEFTIANEYTNDPFVPPAPMNYNIKLTTHWRENPPKSCSLSWDPTIKIAIKDYSSTFDNSLMQKSDSNRQCSFESFKLPKKQFPFKYDVYAAILLNENMKRMWPLPLAVLNNHIDIPLHPPISQFRAAASMFHRRRLSTPTTMHCASYNEPPTADIEYCDPRRGFDVITHCLTQNQDERLLPKSYGCLALVQSGLRKKFVPTYPKITSDQVGQVSPCKRDGESQWSIKVSAPHGKYRVFTTPPNAPLTQTGPANELHLQGDCNNMPDRLILVSISEESFLSAAVSIDVRQVTRPDLSTSAIPHALPTIATKAPTKPPSAAAPTTRPPTAAPPPTEDSEWPNWVMFVLAGAALSLIVAATTVVTICADRQMQRSRRRWARYNKFGRHSRKEQTTATEGKRAQESSQKQIVDGVEFSDSYDDDDSDYDDDDSLYSE